MWRIIQTTFLLGVLCLLPLSGNAWAALQDDTAWEVRPTNGDNTNGACYDTGGTGTDYTLQDAAQLSLTDLAMTAAGTTLTSVTGGFTAAMVDNCIHINSGTNFVEGFYEITARTDTNTVTIDRDATSGGNGSSGAGKVGGATDSVEDIEDNLVAGNTVWVKNEAWNEGITFSVSGFGGSPITIEGYNTSRDDNPTGSNRPDNDRASAAGDAIQVCSSCEDYIFANLIMSNAGDDGFSNTDDHAMYRNIRATGNANNGIQMTSGDEASVGNSQVDNNSGRGVRTLLSAMIYATSANDNSSNGLGLGNGRSGVNCLVYDNADTGMSMGSVNSHALGNTVDGNTGASTDGIGAATAQTNQIWMNNIFSNNGDFGMSCSDCDNIYTDFNNFFGNVTGARNNAPTGENDLALDPGYADAGNDDFAIGTNLKAKGLPNASNAVFPLTECYMDIGACQRQEPAGGGGTTAQMGLMGIY